MLSNPELSIVEIVEMTEDYACLNDGHKCSIPAFMESKVGDRFAVVRELNTITKPPIILWEKL